MNQDLAVEIVDGVLTISIGVDTLVKAVDLGDDSIVVIDPHAFAADILSVLNDEAEDGTTPVHLLFDAAAQRAVEDGSIAVSEEA